MNADLFQELLNRGRELLEACDQLKDDALEAARKDNAYRRAKSIAYLASSGTIPERQAIVDKTCEADRLAAHEAAAIKEAQLERVRSLRTAISAFQTYLNANREEAAFARTGPDFT